jgi:hypothetical protein
MDAPHGALADQPGTGRLSSLYNNLTMIQIDCQELED